MSEARRSLVESTSSRLFLLPASNGLRVLDQRSLEDSFILNFPTLNAALVTFPAVFNDFRLNFTFALLGKIAVPFVGQIQHKSWGMDMNLMKEK